MQIFFKEKRAFKRVSVEEEISISYGNMFYSGTVFNLSQKGMFISTKKCFSLDSTSVIFFSQKNNYMKLFSKIKRVTELNGNQNGIGIELLSYPQVYLEFMEALRP